MQGTVKWFNNRKGYGFITADEKDVFVHYSQITQDGYKVLNKDENVEFDIGHAEDGREIAINVRTI